MEDREKLILGNLGLVGKIAGKHYNQEFVEYEDLFQVGCIGLIKAVNSYKPNQGTKFSSYAYIKIYGEIKDYIRDNSLIKLNRQERFSKNCKVYSLDDYNLALNGVPLKEAIKDDTKIEEEILNNITVLEIQKYISKFSSEQQQALYWKVQGKTQYEISKKLNISQTRTAYLIKKSLKTLRDQLGVKEYHKEKTKDKVVRLTKQGKSLTQIANLLGVTTNYVSTCKYLYKKEIEMRI